MPRLTIRLDDDLYTRLLLFAQGRSTGHGPLGEVSCRAGGARTLSQTRVASDTSDTERQTEATRTPRRRSRSKGTAAPPQNQRQRRVIGSLGICHRLVPLG
jgi:hypothetical protein